MSMEPTDQARIEFGIFAYIHDSRQTYGLRAQDYLRYRRFCAHRLRNVRSAVKLSQGTSTAFRKKEVSADMVSRPEHLEILLLQAERAWAFAMDLRELYSRTEEPRQHYHLIRRLRAALKAGEQLAAAAAGCRSCDERTLLEAHAYKLQIQSQLHFELEEWTSALDCAVLSRVISEQLALAGSSRHYALAHSMIEALDPIVRLAAYRARMAGAQQSQPTELAALWYSTMMLNDVARVEKAISGYSGIASALDAFATEANSCASGDAQALAYANSLSWRGGVVSYASQELAVLVKDAQEALQKATTGDGDDNALDEVAAAFGRAKKAAHRCHSEAVATSAKIHSTASEALESAYLTIQLYSICALHSIAIAKHVGQAKNVATSLGIAIEATENSAFLGHTQTWVLDSKAGKKRGGSVVSKRRGQKGCATDGLAEAVRVVVLYDLIRKGLSSLKASVSGVLERMMPATSRAIHGHQIIEEVAAAEAYYSCVRGYYSAALHASPAHNKHLDSLALLDLTLTETIPRALALATAASKLAVPQSEGQVVDDLWRHAVTVTTGDIGIAEHGIKRAIPIVSRLCATAASANSAVVTQGKAGTSDWVSDPAGRPVMVVNELATSASKSSPGSRPQYVPNLVDLTAMEFAAVPVKPLFYDLVAPSIDFDIDIINQRSGKSSAAATSGSSKLGSIIGNLWGSR
ncbi:signal recognition particle subunit srp68 [Coemansia sp. RSA 2050]|nr:signal recognition particle subunit srp68 [Coemansia sp. RSA 2050]KAJ2736825.1 signal recognition particle subunit srp68 [Coemansia sp. BCRC 34962]